MLGDEREVREDVRRMRESDPTTTLRLSGFKISPIRSPPSYATIWPFGGTARSLDRLKFLQAQITRIQAANNAYFKKMIPFTDINRSTRETRGNDSATS
jgi:hypothetical protein